MALLGGHFMCIKRLLCGLLVVCCVGFVGCGVADEKGVSDTSSKGESSVDTDASEVEDDVSDYTLDASVGSSKTYKFFEDFGSAGNEVAEVKLSSDVTYYTILLDNKVYLSGEQMTDKDEVEKFEVIVDGYNLYEINRGGKTYTVSNASYVQPEEPVSSLMSSFVAFSLVETTDEYEKFKVKDGVLDESESSAEETAIYAYIDDNGLRLEEKVLPDDKATGSIIYVSYRAITDDDKKLFDISDFTVTVVEDEDTSTVLPDIK